MAKENTPIDPIHARLDEIENNLKGQIEGQTKTIEEQAKLIAELSKRQSAESSDEDDAILIDRQSAHSINLPVIEGVPVIAAQMKKVIGIQGLTYLMHATTADKKEHKLPMGADIGAIDFNNEKLEGVLAMSYENLPTKKFKFKNIDENDLTGASKIQKGQIVSEGNTIPEVDRSSGRPVNTGRKIRTVVRRDVRFYTIEHDGKEYTLSSEELGNIRV